MYGKKNWWLNICEGKIVMQSDAMELVLTIVFSYIFVKLPLKQSATSHYFGLPLARALLSTASKIWFVIGSLVHLCWARLFPVTSDIRV